MLTLSIVIPTHNRDYCVSNAIDSAITVFDDSKVSANVIVVDDCSSDKTESTINNKYKSEIQCGRIKYIRLPINKGVSGARNVGIAQASGKWIFFLDSDDILIPGVGQEIAKELAVYSEAPIIFFRCIDQDGNKVGNGFSDISESLSLQEFLKYGSKGECLVAVKRSLIDKIPFDEELRGYEGLTIARILKSVEKPAILSSVIARKYNQTNIDRLSNNAGFSQRIHLISKGHWLMVKEFFGYMSLRTSLIYCLKTIAYKIISHKNNMLRQRIE